MKPYYECHITIEPVFGDRLEAFQKLCELFKFRVAKLLMQKERDSQGSRSDKDSFCTGHSLTYEDMDLRMKELTIALQTAGFEVWRRKIEYVIYDEKCKS